MEPLVLIRELWLPILLSGIVCLVAGALLHMLVPLHKNDWAGLPGEDGVLDAMRKAGVGAGMYMFPWCRDAKLRNTPEFQAKWAAGPTGVVVVMQKGPFSMGPAMVKMVLYHLVVGVLLAYIATRTLDRGTDYLHVFRIIGTVGTMAYGLGSFPQAIWYQFKWSFAVKSLVDGLVFGLLTAGVFGWLWPR
jgi:hypothetical protein